VVRSGLVESVHHARVAVTDPQGGLLVGIGSVTAPMYPRSASKPLQAVALRRCGLPVDGALLALVCASHSGEPFHLQGVRDILFGAGLDESALQTPPDWPLEDARDEYVRAGGEPSSLAMNCSGKHAGMLATAVVNGWPTDSYRDPSHPLQRAVLGTIGDLAGEQPTDVAVDGCGAPLFAISLVGLARAFGRLAAAEKGEERVVADAIRRHPAWTSGTRRDEKVLHEAIPGLVTKGGAEAVQAVGLADGRGVAIKISDGSTRARPVLTAAVLLALGLRSPVLESQARSPVFGHGEPVGAVQIRSGALASIAHTRVTQH
jgi:L-asparaginase II